MSEHNPLPKDAVRYIDRTRRLYDSQPPYRWVNHDTDPPPWAPIIGPLEHKRVALIASGGVHRQDQPAFHFHNDVSHREIEFDSPAAKLRVAHFGYDTTDAKQDTACVLPLRALREMANAGEIAGLAGPALSFMGGIYSARQVSDDIAPRFRDIVLREKADLALLVPV